MFRAVAASILIGLIACTFHERAHGFSRGWSGSSAADHSVMVLSGLPLYSPR